jgi:hypothetical protein
MSSQPSLNAEEMLATLREDVSTAMAASATAKAAVRKLARLSPHLLDDVTRSVVADDMETVISEAMALLASVRPESIAEAAI